MIGNWIIGLVGYGTALSFGAASALGFFGALKTKAGSRSEGLAVIWWALGAIASLIFAGVTRGLLGVCAA